MRRRTATGRGLGKPETFNFLGFTFICGKSRRGKFLLKGKPARPQGGRSCKPSSEECAGASSQPPSRFPVQGKWLRQVVKGYFNYHAVPTNNQAPGRIPLLRHRTLAAIAQATQSEDGTTWAQITQLAKDWLRTGLPFHPWPRIRFAVTHPRWRKLWAAAEVVAPSSSIRTDGGCPVGPSQ